MGWQQWVGGGGGGSISKNRPSHHQYKSPKQFELKQSCPLRSLNALLALLFYLIFEDEKHKKTDRTNIIATNFA